LVPLEPFSLEVQAFLPEDAALWCATPGWAIVMGLVYESRAPRPGVGMVYAPGES
jgi:hypothetical protein